MNNTEKILMIVSELKGLFSEKADLRGIGDWDVFIGCLIALEEMAKELNEPKGE